ncbi:MAG: transposase [Synechococcus sp.]
MARTKLTPEARLQLVEQYRQPGITVAMLAEQFGVSSSTASRVLKEDIPAQEYKVLVRQKRAGRPTKRSTETQPFLLNAIDATESEAQEEFAAPKAAIHDTDTAAAPASETYDLDTDIVEKGVDDYSEGDGERTDDDRVDETAEQLEAELFGDSEDEDEDEADEYISSAFDDEEFDEEDEEFDEEDEEFDEEDEVLTKAAAGVNEDEIDTFPWGEQPSQVEVVGPSPAWLSAVQANPELAPPTASKPINILELETLDLPQQCFAVVDRFQELTTCPLQEFNHLGEIPQELTDAKALPLFDSHRIARRFSDRFRHRGRHKHRVIGFPGYFLEVARDQLQAKGITHLLLDNQVYEL